MNFQYINYDYGLPIKIFVNSPRNKFHLHDGLELIWVLDGELFVQVENKKIMLYNDDLLLVNSFSNHRLNTGDDNKFLVMEIEKSFCQEYIADFNNKYFLLNSSNEKQQRYELIRFLFSRMIDIYNKKTIEMLDNINNNLIKMLKYIEDNFTIDQGKSQLSKFDNSKYIIINEMIEHIKANYMDKITLKNIAEEKHYNTSYLSEKFKDFVGINFKDYVDIVRLYNAMKSILYKNENISDIAYNNGFCSLKSFYRAFHRYYNCTPGEYRNLYRQTNNDQDDGGLYVHRKVKTYLDKGQLIQDNKEEALEKEITVNIDNTSGILKKSWQKIINIGSVYTILDSNVQAQIIEMQKDIGFEYLRFEGIFNDEMEVCKLDENGDIYYNWKFVDKVFDFMFELKLKPFVCLSFMPDVLAKTNKKVFHYRANASPPKKIEQWLDLVYSFFIHCINRYGMDSIEKWYFQIWGEFSFYNLHWDGTDEEYFLFYKKTAEEIKKISKSIKIGPASENYYYGYRKSRNFLQYCKENNVPIDFYNANIYHNRILNEKDLDFNKADFFDDNTLLNVWFGYSDKMHTVDTADETKALLKDFYPHAEFMVVRWNMSWDVKEYVHDTAFMATYVVDTALKAGKKVEGMGFLSLSDVLYEWPIDEGPFFGGSGLVNTEGIKKPSYYAFWLLSKLGSTVVEQGDYYIVTKKSSDIQILVYNYSYLNNIYMKGNSKINQISKKNRYKVFERKDDIKLNLNIKGLKGKYKLRHYYLNRENGSAFDEWVELGCPYELNDEEIKYLKIKSYPKMKIERVDCEKEYTVKTEIPVHGIELIVLNKIYEI
ncbi:MAG: helix-turn-helix domain-containing protein [Firmicutes bacterium]|nr:helix-turn-helix domain-containing protein [Bacillota bacterium]